MKTLLLAAGISKRLHPLSDKNFLPFSGKPLVRHQLEKLRSAGLNDIIIIANKYNLAAFKSLADDSITVVEQKDLEAGMKGAVLACKELISGQRILIVSGNDIIEEKGYKLVINAAESEVDGVLLAKKVSSYFPGGYLDIDADQRILGIVEKPGEGNEPGDVINLVTHYHRNADILMDALDTAASDNDDLYEVALDQLFRNYQFQAAVYDDSWLAVKYPWHILEVMNAFLASQKPNIHESAHIADTAVVKGDVVIGEGTKIFDQAVVQGPCYIGKNCIIANNSLVRNSMLGDNCVAGYSTEIARSWLGNDVWTHANYIGDSIIDSNVSFGSGTVTGNLRLDEKNIAMDIRGEQVSSQLNKFGAVIGSGVRVGINVSIMPGKKIGRNTFIGGGISIAQDIPDNSFVTGETKLKITENRVGEVKMERDKSTTVSSPASPHP